MKQIQDRVILVDHPMVQHKLSILRDKNTSTAQFRQVVREIALFEGYEATSDLPLEPVEVETPLEKCTCMRLTDRQVTIVPILRAGLGMLDAMLDLIPSAHVGHLGMERDPETHEPHEYYAKMPTDVAESDVIIVDPMLATGGSSIDAINNLRARGVKRLKLMVLVAVPEGIKAVLEADPDVIIYTCAIDRCLNDQAYILPGLGDAGDRIFGTVQ